MRATYGAVARAVFVALTVAAGESRGGTTVIELPQAATTSVGIFDANGRLVRTLWSGRSQPAGALRIEWNGLDDEGRSAPASQTYAARVLAHHVRYTWEGVIGNTSADMTGAHVHRALEPVNDMVIDAAGNAFYVVGYNEQQSALHRFSVADPQRADTLAHDDYRNAFRLAATDGVLAYFANDRSPTFVMALRVTDGAEYAFPAGRSEPAGSAAAVHWQSVIDYDNAPAASSAAPTGLAVQRRGDSLFVSHARANEIRVLDKHTGASWARIAVPAPSRLAMAPDDSLWVLCGCGVRGRRAVAHYRLSGGQWSEAAPPVTDLDEPVALGVSRDGTLVVADAATGQLQGYDSTGRRLWTLGQRGGYFRNGPDVRVDKFWFSPGPTYVAFQEDGSFWVGDPANARNLHFSARREYLGQIMYLPKSYVSTADAADPTRVFSGFLEFKVDYSRRLRDSWQLVRNWGAGLDQRYFGEMAGLRSVTTLGNGRTYGSVARTDLQGSELVELTARSARPTGIRLDVGTRLYADGSLRRHALNASELKVYRRALVDFDGAGNPTWGEPALLARTALQRNDPYYHDVPLVPAANDVGYPDLGQALLVSFNPGRSQGFHLGALRHDGQGWEWRVNPTGTWSLDRDGNVVGSDGVYETGRGVQYLGSRALTSGSQVIFGYFGEAWNGGQANQWLHFFANGLFVGQFGRPTYVRTTRLDAPAGCAGNAFSAQLVDVNGQLYLWHNDESVHGGVHRWHIENVDQIKILEAPITP